MWKLCSELRSTNKSSTLGLIFLSLIKFGKGRRKAAFHGSWEKEARQK